MAAALPLGLGLALGLLACDPAGRGDQAFKDGDSHRAIQAYQRADALTEPQRQRMALAYIREQDPVAAGGAMALVETLSAEGHLVMGILGQQEGDVEGALEHFRSGLELQVMPQLSVNACVLALQADPQGALVQCQQAMEAAPMDPLPKLALAASSLDAGLLMSARELLIVLETTKLSETEAAWLVALWERAGDPARACQAGLDRHLRTLSAASSCLATGHPTSEDMLAELDSPQAHALLLRLYTARAEQATAGPARVRQVTLAQAQLRALGDAPREAAVQVDQARLARLEGDLPRAQALLEQAAAQRPPVLAAWLNLARILAEQGGGERALELLEGAPAFSAMESMALELELLQLAQAHGALEIERAQALAQRCEQAGQARCMAQSCYVLAVEWAAQDLEQGAIWLQRSVDAGGASMAQRALGERSLLPVLQSPWLSAWAGDPTLAEIHSQALQTRIQTGPATPPGL